MQVFRCCVKGCKLVLYILCFCETKDLSNIRLVNQVWFRVSSKRWINEYCLVFNKRYTLATIEEVKQFIKYWVARYAHEIKRVKPTSLVICGWHINELLGKRFFAKYWKETGPNLKFLRLKDCQLFDTNTFKTMLQHAYNVQHLVLDNVTFGGYTAPQNVSYWQSFLTMIRNYRIRQPRPQSQLKTIEFISDDGNCDFSEWYYLFYNCPNFKVIRIKATNYFMVVNFETRSIYLHLKTARINQPTNQQDVLGEMDAAGVEYVWEGLLQMVSSFGIPLQKLNFGFGVPEFYDANLDDNGVTFNVDRNIPAALFERMLRDCSKTLETLTCISSHKYNSFDFSAFSERLIDLELVGDVFSTAEFLNHTPNLKKFRWQTTHDVISQSADLPYAADVHLEQLKQFLYETPTGCATNTMNLIRTWCPGIVKLGLSLNEDSFRFVTSKFPGLQSLQIMHNSYLCSEDIVKFNDDELSYDEGILQLKNLEELLMPHFVYGILWRLDVPLFREALYELPNLSKLVMNTGNVCVKLLN